MGDTSGELAEGRELLGLHQAVLRGAEVVQRFATARGCAAAPRRTAATLPMAITAWSAKVLSSCDCLSQLSGLDAGDADEADALPLPIQRNE